MTIGNDLERSRFTVFGISGASVRRKVHIVHRVAAAPSGTCRDLQPGPMWATAFAVICAFTISGCATLDYYGHALAGQFDIWRKKVSIEDLLVRGDLASELRDKLQYAVRAREFAFNQLALPDNGSYRAYVDLGRDFVVWNVFAAPELSLDPAQSCYPFAGCFDYRGFFDEDRAKRHAQALERRGLDVFIGGVSAYSTLGWFDDPVLSSILKWEKSRIAEIIFHELAHQRMYVASDTTFNESFAMAVATEGLRLWMPLQGGAFSDVARQ